MSVQISVESARGCGYRKQGGLYLVAGKLTEPCPRLPLPVTSCPHCGQGIKPARGYTWVVPATLFPASVHGSEAHNDTCPLGINPALPSVASAFFHRTGDRAGLIWVGEAFYATPGAFLEEASRMGVSRRIVAVPRGFKVGETWVYLGHRKAIEQRPELGQIDPPEPLPGIITLFKPTAIEYVLRDGEEDDAELLDSLAERGITPIKVVREGQTDLEYVPDEPEDD